MEKQTKESQVSAEKGDFNKCYKISCYKKI